MGQIRFTWRYIASPLTAGMTMPMLLRMALGNPGYAVPEIFSPESIGHIRSRQPIQSYALLGDAFLKLFIYLFRNAFRSQYLNGSIHPSVTNKYLAKLIQEHGIALPHANVHRKKSSAYFADLGTCFEAMVGYAYSVHGPAAALFLSAKLFGIPGLPALDSPAMRTVWPRLDEKTVFKMIVLNKIYAQALQNAPEGEIRLSGLWTGFVNRADAEFTKHLPALDEQVLKSELAHYFAGRTGYLDAVAADLVGRHVTRFR